MMTEINSALFLAIMWLEFAAASPELPHQQLGERYQLHGEIAERLVHAALRLVDPLDLVGRQHAELDRHVTGAIAVKPQDVYEEFRSNNEKRQFRWLEVSVPEPLTSFNSIEISASPSSSIV